MMNSLKANTYLLGILEKRILESKWTLEDIIYTNPHTQNLPIWDPSTHHESRWWNDHKLFASFLLRLRYNDTHKQV